MAIINLIGLILNVIGTVVVSLCASRVMLCVHIGLMAHQTTLTAHHVGRHDFPMIVGLDESREREMTRGTRLLRYGLWLVVIGFVLQGVAALPGILNSH